MTDAAPNDPHADGRWTFLGLAAIALVAAMSAWFSATAVIADLAPLWRIDPATAGWLTTAVQIGFVFGAVGSSFVSLADIMSVPRLMAASAVLAALANAVLLLEPPFALAVLSRVAVGAALAGVYPPAMKLAATWFRRGRGLALGILIGALTLGSSSPHFSRAVVGGVDWQIVVAASTVLTLAGAAVCAVALKEGPFAFPRATFDPQQTIAVLRNRPMMLANLGYFGHMWELYAMWGWFLAFAAAADAGGLAVPFGGASMATFVVVASGAFGAVLGGAMADRIGRCATTSLMMAASGLAAVTMGFAFDGPAWLFAAVGLVWGVTVIGDSAQFSAAVTELADPRLVGTALALQMGIGFALTVVSIALTPVVVEALGGWRWGFVFLVPGPLLGIFAMMTLRALPDAARLAGGRR